VPQSEWVFERRRVGAFYPLHPRTFFDARHENAYIEWDEGWRGGALKWSLILGGTVSAALEPVHVYRKALMSAAGPWAGIPSTDAEHSFQAPPAFLALPSLARRSVPTRLPPRRPRLFSLDLIETR